jgi:putative ABC transport system permease protein
VSTMRYASSTFDGQTVSVLGIDPVAYPEVAGLNFQQGNAETAYPELANGRTIIPNGIFASQAGLKIGDTVTLSTPQGERPYRVVAVAGDYLNAKINTAYISQVNMAADFRKTEDIFIQLNLVPGIDPATVEPKLKEIAADYPQFNLISGRAYYEQNKQIFDSIFVFYYALFLVLALPSLIAILNTLAIGVIERTREIGMLRAIGSTRKQVSRMVLTEALLLSAVGTAFGLLAGLYLGYVIVTGLGSVGFPVSYNFPAEGLLAAIAVGLIFGALAAIIPARQATHLEIVRALRYE